MPDHELRTGLHFSPRVEIVAPVVALVGIIGFGIVFEAVYDGVVVHVGAKEKFGRIDIVAQKGLDVIGLQIVVLVKVVDQVVVLVEAGKHLDIGSAGRLLTRHKTAAGNAPPPVGKAVLIVVVIDKLIGKVELVLVVDKTALVGNDHGGAVVRIHGKDLAIGEPRIGQPRGRDVKSLSAVGR